MRRAYLYSAIAIVCSLASFGLVYTLNTGKIDLKSLPLPYRLVSLKPLELGGWNHTPNELTHLIKEFGVKTVVEIGVWKGASSIHMAKQLPPEGKVYSVDHFEGSPELVGFSYEYPILYDQFLSNVIHEKLTGKIIPIKMSSLRAAEHLKNLSPDMIYIDGDHSYKAIMEDLNAWYPLVAGHGILCGDDFSLKPGDVATAVKDFCREKNLKYITKNHPTLKKPWFWIIEVSPKTDKLFNPIL